MGIVSPASGAAPPATVTANAIVRDLRAGRSVVLDHVRVKGPLNLAAADSVRADFKCRECAFEGPVSGSDALFE